MTLTSERAEKLSQVFLDDMAWGKELLYKEPNEVVAEVNAKGYDFTEAEIVEYGEAAKVALSQGELNEADLSQVSGGGAILVIAGACAVAFLTGVAVGGLKKLPTW